MKSAGGFLEVTASGSQQAWLERLPPWVKRLVTIGTLSDDGEEERLQKASLVLTASMITVLAVIWVMTYFLLGLYVPAVIPLAYQVISIASIAVLARTKRFDSFRSSQLGLMLLLPMFLQWSLGGFVASSGVMLWALVSPLVALILSPRPLPWFLSYLGLTAVSGVLEPFLIPAPIPETIKVLFAALNIGGVSAVVYFLLRYFMGGLALEREKSERLLLNVLPASIASRLKAGERPLADRFEDVAVLFADLVDFTPISEKLAPEEVVAMLDRLFSEFDAIAERRQLEKIKTVGDAYLVVGGLPDPRPDAAEAVAEMALDMRALIASNATSFGGPLSLRIGIDIGPVVAGVIGQKKFTYDLWGDTVNTASRMESHGIPGEIQVTPRAYERLKHRIAFNPASRWRSKAEGKLLHSY